MSYITEKNSQLKFLKKAFIQKEVYFISNLKLINLTYIFKDKRTLTFPTKINPSIWPPS